MNADLQDAFKAALKSEEIRGDLASAYHEAAEADPVFAAAIIDSKLAPIRQTGKHVPNGTEQSLKFGELDDQSEVEFVAATGDPSDDLASRIDGPPLLDKESDWEHFADGLMRLFDWMRGHNRVGRIPPHDVGVRCLTVAKQLFPDLTASELETRYGLSRQSISQQQTKFREEFGELRTLKTRSPEQRQHMAEAQGRVNHWKRRKKPPESGGTQAAAMKTEPTFSSATCASVNCSAEVAK
jgi:hypothetical protein